MIVETRNDFVLSGRFCFFLVEGGRVFWGISLGPWEHFWPSFHFGSSRAGRQLAQGISLGDRERSLNVEILFVYDFQPSN